jgi:hypothetical protein
VSTYEALVREVVEAKAEEIAADLEFARQELRLSRLSAEAHERRVFALEALVALAPAPKEQDAGSHTLHAAMEMVLQTAPEQMMRAGDIAREIERRRLYRMRDGRPVETQQIRARVGHYGDRFKKVGTFIKLRIS